ncbi:YbaB/EbfC family nucleoid-associated protein [Candidatus Falkowbacteria bacterium]|mgnify:FL=1|jgi:DNA-binding protein YbaB|nr:YbaB/EbfC family nucleoid-associated protein [Candidatus Falkowbacteria bacterium]MBT5503229.1 YbaB/EbfC family nucleoid-associated protein [Candidatus Falkowbacteria bacterium]MBT6574228.1 YbaB/EbfC family nucleoid-associated protein [Candidatus Falkowbacteria bacterium]MBT7348527.1 YbaB/EbfC family nucleoid-associated protein [Candidatus Falkowbacteria bacterium]MBT7500807.1 YbaB/EbfC family nucleoid-associated protein [Candidatus Falkowbacteria bacterium]
MFDKLKMLKQAKDLQSKMASMNFDHEENGIKLSVNGKQEVISLEITNDELLEDKEKLERLLKQTVNNAIQNSQRQAAMSMQGELGGLF